MLGNKLKWTRQAAICAAFVISCCNAIASPITEGCRPASGIGVIPDSCGSIAEILLQYDPDLHIELKPLYNDLFWSLPDDVKLTVLCPSLKAAERFKSTWGLLLKNRVVDIVNVGVPISIWARDRCIARQPTSLLGRGQSFVPMDAIEYGPEKHNDLLLQDILNEAHLAPGVLSQSFQIEGGNVVSNQKHVFLGINVFEDNPFVDPVRLESGIRNIFGKDCVILGDSSGQSPWCHVDMYLTPVGEDTVLVSSTQFALQLLALCDDDYEETTEYNEVFGEFCLTESLQDGLDDVALLAEKTGYHVVRLPAVANDAEQWMITYNNVLIEQRDGRNIVYVPVYDVPTLDRAAQTIYQSLGFEVRTIDVSRIYDSGGALRCVANVVRRNPSELSIKHRRSVRGRVRVMDLAGSKGYDGTLLRSMQRVSNRSRVTWTR